MVLAGAVLAMLGACQSQAGVLAKWLDRSSWFAVWRLSFICPVPCCKEIRVSLKRGQFPLELHHRLWSLVSSGSGNTGGHSPTDSHTHRYSHL